MSTLREAVERLAAKWDDDTDGRHVYWGAVPDLHCILAEHPAPEVAPGLCWSRGGTVWPNGIEPRCELRAGHAGAHECDRGSMGGTAVWTDPEEPR